MSTTGGDWFLDALARGGFGALLVAWGYEDVCPKCADRLALETEHEVEYIGGRGDEEATV